MSGQPLHRKRVHHYHEPGHFHELTFSCYQQAPLLTNDTWRQMLSTSIERATQRQDFRLVAFVYMPEHVHLLVYPSSVTSRVDGLLKAIKQPFSNRVRRQLEAASNSLVERLTVQERPGKRAFQFWQEGGGYDRNLMTTNAVRQSIDYIHANPVRRGLATEAMAWPWSSCRHYASDGRHQDAALPRIDGPPPEIWDSK